MFQKTRLKRTEEKEAKAWLTGPKMKYWPQQLNFAVFCATQACGISRQIFDSGLALAPQIRAFYQFYVYFTIRRVLFQLGGIQSKNALPCDPTFNPLDNPYDEAPYGRLCREFGIAPSSDFWFRAIYLYMYDIDATGKAEWAHFPTSSTSLETNISATSCQTRPRTGSMTGSHQKQRPV